MFTFFANFLSLCYYESYGFADFTFLRVIRCFGCSEVVGDNHRKTHPTIACHKVGDEQLNRDCSYTLTKEDSLYIVSAWIIITVGRTEA
jgi:hypothetical protein